MGMGRRQGGSMVKGLLLLCILVVLSGLGPLRLVIPLSLLQMRRVVSLYRYGPSSQKQQYRRRPTS